MEAGGDRDDQVGPVGKKDDDPNIDGEKYEVTRLTPQETEQEKGAAEDRVPVRFGIGRKDLDKHGFTNR